MENLEILYEDNHIIVVQKPQNILSQGDETGDKSLLDIVKDYIKEKYNKKGNVYVGLVHRLDRPTGGIMVFAKTSKAAERLSSQLKDKTFSKKYLAVVVGTPKYKSSRLEHYLRKDEKENKVSVCTRSTDGAKQAILEYKTIKSDKGLSLLEIKILTGRSHQIRVQMAEIKNPIFGDQKYGMELPQRINLALWAYELSFIHPTNKKEMIFKSVPPIKNAPWNIFENEINKLTNI